MRVSGRSKDSILPGAKDQKSPDKTQNKEVHVEEKRSGPNSKRKGMEKLRVS